MIMSSSFVTTSMAEFDFLVSFLLGLWLAKMPICSILVDHGRIISVTVKKLVTSTLSVRSTVTRPRPMHFISFLDFDVQYEVLFRVVLIMTPIKHPDKTRM